MGDQYDDGSGQYDQQYVQGQYDYDDGQYGGDDQGGYGGGDPEQIKSQIEQAIQKYEQTHNDASGECAPGTTNSGGFDVSFGCA